MKLSDIKGIGPKTEQLFLKLGIKDAEGLVHYYPCGYEEYGEPLSAGALVPGMKNALAGIISGSVTARRTGKYHITTTVISDPTGSVRLTWFNAPFVPGLLKKGSSYIFRGNVRKKNGSLCMDHPEIINPFKYREMMNSLAPVYGLTRGLSGKTIARSVRYALEHEPSLSDEYLPESLMRLHGLMDEEQALCKIHFPQTADELLEARRRLVFDDFFMFILGIRMLKSQEEEEINEFPMHKVWETEDLIESLPFRLTDAQLRVWHEIEADLSSGKLMQRLVQGDVGSGKTIIAFLAMAMAAVNGFQSVLLTPTEVLARQHFEKIEKMRAEKKADYLMPVLLTGSLKTDEKKAVNELIQKGMANCIIGTHAVLEQTVHYRNLGLIITDEQHRFGVRQRNALRERGSIPHMIVMSATPIPRTLGMIYYGDLDISVIDELPARRRPVKTAVVDENWMENAWSFIRRQAEEGHQIYVICPMIEPSEDFQTYNVMDEAARLRKIFPQFRVEMLHGRMKADEKNHVMELFLKGEIHILVSTTVIEVGVDVPNATVMMVMGSERFGLAQLHQLRGRVGRGEDQSYCIFLAGMSSEETLNRLNVLKESNDGFVIAEKDFMFRGPGDLLGIRQSGDAMFRIADVTKDAEILKLAGETAASVINDDPALLHPEHELLKKELNRYLTANERKIVL